MSQTPDKETVNQLRELAKQYRRYMRDLSESESKEEMYRNQSSVLSSAVSQTRRSITDLIEKMDCKASGNGGWENRIAWMLSELVSEEQ